MKKEQTSRIPINKNSNLLSSNIIKYSTVGLLHYALFFEINAVLFHTNILADCLRKPISSFCGVTTNTMVDVTSLQNSWGYH